MDLAVSDEARVTEAGNEEPAFLTEVRDKVLIITLNRPTKANALRRQDTRALAELFEAAFERGDARAVLLRAAGENFCAGADLVSGNAGGKARYGAQLHGLAANAHRLIQAIWDCPLPTVSAVQGRSAGLGFHLSLASDFIVSSPDASFVQPFVKIGFSVDSGGSWLLPRLIGLSRARHLLLRGAELTANEASALGLVTLAATGDDLDTAAHALAAELATGPTFALGLTKRMANKHIDTDLRTAMADEAASVELSIRNSDFKEGIRAFFERRPAKFTGA